MNRQPSSDDKQTSASNSDRTEEFLRLLSMHQRQIHNYAMTLVPSSSDVDDILQETNLVLWREFAKYQPGTNFKAWACRIAMNQALAWRKRRQRDRLQFSEEFLHAVAKDADAMSDELHDRSEMLESCIRRLPEHHQELIRLRYQNQRAVDTIARQVNRSVAAVYRLLGRIRHNLHECVSLKLRETN